MKIDFEKILKKKTAFDRINPAKREKIMIAAVDEFADKGYHLASTSRIAKRAGIAKGALFKYFKTKERLFLSITDELLIDMFVYIMKRISARKQVDILTLYMDGVEELFDYFKGNLKMFRLYKMIISERSGEVFHKIRKKYEPYMAPMVESLMKKVDRSNLSVSMQEMGKLFIWLDAGMDAYVMSIVTPNTTVDEMKKIYKENLAIVEKVLKNGIYKK